MIPILRGGLLDLARAFVILNAPLPKGIKMAPSAVANVPDLGARSAQRVTLDPAAQTLTVSPLVGSPGTSVSWDTDAPVAAFGAPDPFTVDLNAGALTMSLPLDLPPGPGGFTPPVSLSYSSASVSEQHGIQAGASWVGEGWNVSLGSISWSEQDVTAGCNCAANWENKWELSDPFGTSAELIPPNINISTFTDDTGNSITPSPIFWQTAPATHAKVVSYTGPITLGGLAAPCFRVFLTTGIMEEFGCTPDSLRYYLEPSGANQGKLYISAWLLDLITDRHGNQIHLTYQWDTQTGAGGQTYPRDAELATIEYDSPTCQNVQTACTGSAWAPLMRVNFVASQTPARLTNTPSNCNTASNTRCDDPIDLSGSGGLPAPTVQSTLVLNDIQVQVRTSGSGSWNTLHDYQLGYEQSGPSTITDPATGKQESVAGMLDLTTFQLVGDDGTTAQPMRTFSYTTLTEHYEDDAYLSSSSTNCGPSWNQTACLLWSQSYTGNSRYLATADNGQGMQQVFSWAEARNNTHGVIGGGSNTADPLYCDGKEAQGYPCSQADDQNWSHAVLTQETDTVLRVAQNGQGGQQTSTPVTSITSYSYQLTYPLIAEPCSDCVAGMYWGNQNDADFLDYYNNHFMGFAQATVTHPDGSVEVHHYYSTEGWGLYDTSQVTCASINPCHNDPWWALPNAAHGHETEVDSYDTDGTTLLKQTFTQYQALCPGSGVSGTPAWSGWGNWNGNLVSALDHNNPVASCDVQTTQTDTYTYDGSVTPTTPIYMASQGFSATQGQNQWRYQYSTDGEQTFPDMTYDSTNTRWYGSQASCLVGSNWQQPAPSGCDAIRTWVAPSAGTAILASNGPMTVATGCGGSLSQGIQLRVLKNGTQIWPSSGWKYLNHGDALPFPLLAVAVAAGDQIHFVLGPLSSNNNCDTTTWDAQVTLTSGGLLHTATTNTYDSYGRVIATQTLSDDGGSPGSPTSTITHTAYVWNDAVTATATSATGTYLISFPAYSYTLDGNGHQASCSYTSYDGLTDEVGAQSNFTGAGNVTATAQYTSLSTSTCGYQASRGFSAVQGQNQWRYQYSTDGESTFQDMTYDSTNDRWTAPGRDTFCLIWANGQAPDGIFFYSPTCDSVRTWVAPSAGTVTLSANGPISVAGPCGNVDGVKLRVLKNGTQIWPASGWKTIETSASFSFPPQITSVAAGDHIQFVLNENGWPDCDSTTWDPQVDFGATGTGTVPTVYQTTPNTVFQASTGFSGTQGQNQWSYQYSTDTETTFNPMTYNSSTQQWQGSATYCLIWANGQHPNTGGNGIGPGCDSIRTWTAPSGGEVMIDANGLLSLAAECNGNGGGVNIRVLKNGSPFWPSSSVWQTINHGSTFSFPTLQVNLATGDQLQFVVAHIGALDDCDQLTWDPRITTLNNWVATTTTTYDSYGNPLTTTDPDANAGDATHTGCTLGGSTTYSTCRAYDTTFAALPISATNALNQTANVGYTQTAAGGFGLWPTFTTDRNGQITTNGYDALGRGTSQTLPGETSGLTTTSKTYTNFCAATGAQAPCLEIDQTQRLDASTPPVITRAFYDGEGHLVETRTPGPNGQDVVQYTYYDPSGRQVFASNPYYVTAYTGGPGAAAYSLPDSTQSGTSTTYPNLRSTTAQDALSNPTTTSSSVVCNAAGTNDGACYLQTLAVDALGHQSGTLTDAFGREVYAQEYTGNSSATYGVYATTINTYDAQGHVVQILQPDHATTTSFLYDAGGHQIRLIDPDRGTELYFYDANGNPVESVDARGSAGTFYLGYDALNRQLWRNTTNSPSGAYVTYTYDGAVPAGVSCSGITPGSNALGHLTTEQFKSGPSNSFSGAYCDSYDARGQAIGEVDTLAGTTYLPILYTYNDAGMPLKLTYPTTEYALNNYSAQGWLTSITRSARGTTNLLVPSITYNGAAGAAGEPDSYVVGGSGSCSSANSSIICASFSYDGDLRPTQATYTHPTSSTPITYYSLGLTYDAVGNITSLSSGLPAAGGQSGGQDNQQFCYDEQDRLTWAGNNGTNPCTSQTVTGTTLPSGSTYTASYQYDVLDRIAQSTLTGALVGNPQNPQGTYTYDSQHLHAVDAIGSGGYTAQYDAAGDMTCRAPTGTQVCTSSSQTGAQLTYDVEGRLIQWVSADGLTTVKYGYDGEGQRFEMQVTSGGTTTTTTYIGVLEEVQTVSGGATTKIVYFYWGGQRIAEDDNTHWYYPITDQLTSPTVIVDYTGVIATQLFGPYGQVRWAGGTMPTSYAFTGQRSDSATGLDYYGARYYDPQAGQFTSADTVLDGPDRYAYVAGNPISNVDPSGHDWGSFWNGVKSDVKGFTDAVQYGAQCLSGGVQGCEQQLWNNAVTTCSNDPGGCAASVTDAAQGVESNLNTLAQVTGVSSMQQDAATLESGNASTGQKVAAAADFVFNEVVIFTTIAGIGGVGEAAEAGDVGLDTGAGLGDIGDGGDACGLSFSADTLVATPTGEQAISSLKVGDQVQAYNPSTHQQSTQTVEKVWINHDTDLLDVTVQALDASPSQTKEPARTQDGVTQPLPPMIARGEDPNLGAAPAGTGKNTGAVPPGATPDETIHTTANHPWLTADQGWVQAGKLIVGEPVVRADGKLAVVVAVQVVPGAGFRYDLTVSHIHTFEVGLGQWVVHNCNYSDLKTTVDPGPDGTTVKTGVQEGDGPYFESWLSKDGSTFETRLSYRNGLKENASYVWKQHFLRAGGDTSKLKIIMRMNVENEETLAYYKFTEELYGQGTLVGSPFDKSIGYFAQELGIKVGPPKWSGSNIIWPVLEP